MKANMEATYITSDSSSPSSQPSPVRLMPLRGIIPARNVNAVSYELTTLRKWIRLNRVVFKVDRADVLLGESEGVIWPDLCDFASAEQLRLSPRISVESPTDPFLPVLSGDIHDLCLVYSRDGLENLDVWLQLAKDRKISVRVRVLAMALREESMSRLADLLLQSCAVSVDGQDSFADATSSSGVDSSTRVALMNQLVSRLSQKGVDVALTGLPFCHVAPDNLPYAMNSTQCFCDHLQYHKDSFIFAERVFRFKSGRVSKAIENQLARKTSLHNLIDAALFPWIIDYPRFYIRVWMFHKLTRHLPFMHRDLRPIPETLDAYERELEQYHKQMGRVQGSECSQCQYRGVCDRETPAFKSAFPGLNVKACSGETLAAAPCDVFPRKRYYDALDSNRLKMPERVITLAEKARDMLLQGAPSREISADTYDIVGRFTHHMPGAVRWLSFGTGELTSTILARLEPPFTISFTVGGGIAEFAGFSFGRYAKILCPLIDYSHRVTLSVAADGCYALLRDGQVVRPVEFESALQLPARLGGVLEPRLSLHNIDGMLLTQTVLLWERGEPAAQERTSAKYSVVIISTRYTRRLQATLMALAHQQGVDGRLYEVVVGYVPGIDATDDLLDSMESTFPSMRIVRVPFAEGRARAKGFMINEASHTATGKWVLLMDADIVLPPNTFATLEQVEDGQHFIAPDGRKMLPPETTGRILLNELRPWESYAEIMDGPGEIRRREADGIPIGFFQCVRREILERIPYHELDHFEASDWHFGRDVTVNYGREHRLQEFYVLHLDHGGSQWYGTHKHR